MKCGSSLLVKLRQSYVLPIKSNFNLSKVNYSNFCYLNKNPKEIQMKINSVKKFNYSNKINIDNTENNVDINVNADVNVNAVKNNKNNTVLIKFENNQFSTIKSGSKDKNVKSGSVDEGIQIEFKGNGIPGKIQLIIGPMFSGKSTELIRYVRKFEIKKYKTTVVRSIIDDRYTNNNYVVTHDMHKYPAISCKKLGDIRDKLMEYSVIAIDEGQFYLDIVEESEFLANNGKIVIIAALSSNFKRESFENISKLIPKCDIITNLQAVCYNCNEDANFTLRLKSDNKNELLVGDDKIYKPCCRKCYHNYNVNLL